MRTRITIDSIDRFIESFCLLEIRMGRTKKQKTRKKRKSSKKKSSHKAPLPRGFSKGIRGRRVTLSWGIKRYLSKLKKAGY